MLTPRSLLALLLLLVTAVALAQSPPPPAPRSLPQHAAAPPSLLVSVLDENGVAVPAAVVVLTDTQTGAVRRSPTDFAGRVRFPALPPGTYSVRVEKPGFYVFNTPAIEFPATQIVETVLTHQQEVKETVNVTAAAAHTIQPAQTASTGTLTGNEVINVPYPTSRDVRNILRFIPGVVQDNTGQFHVDGAADYQNLQLLDGFNITDPVSGALNMRFSADAVRAIDVERSRVSARYGRESGGVMAFTTGMGDDRFRFSATNFIPSVQNKKGLSFDKFVPRATFSGPLRKGKAWFFLAPEFEYDQDIVKELPAGADRNHVLRGSNLAKVQVNLTPRNILTGSFLYNRLHSSHDGLNPFQPLSVTQDLDSNAFLFGLRDQQYFQNGVLAEVALGWSQFEDLSRPMGPAAMIITPEGLLGNYFKVSKDHGQRLEGMANVFLPPISRWGKHELLFGTDSDHVRATQFHDRRPIFILREDSTLQRETTFSPAHPLAVDNLELGAYAQDRWTPAKPLLLELGLRWDWNRLVNHLTTAPRLAATYMLGADTKLSAGLGWYYDNTPLAFFAAPLDGERFDTEFAADGVTPLGPPVTTRFRLNRSLLQPPRFLNYSVAVERKLPAAIYLRAEYIRKRGTHEFVFLNTTSAPLGGDFLLTNSRQDHFDSFQVTVHRSFKEQYELFAAYTRSSVRSNEVFDFNLDNPVFSAQGAGPYPWNTPNRFISWGYVPIPHTKKWALAYSMEMHSGFAFSAVNDNQQVVGRPNSYRFPAFLTIDPFIEYRFRLRGHDLAIRVGSEDVTGRRNPTSVNNNINSPQFLTFSGVSGRAFTARIRFLGHK